MPRTKQTRSAAPRIATRSDLWNLGPIRRSPRRATLSLAPREPRGAAVLPQLPIAALRLIHQRFVEPREGSGRTENNTVAMRFENAPRAEGCRAAIVWLCGALRF